MIQSCVIITLTYRTIWNILKNASKWASKRWPLIMNMMWRSCFVKKNHSTVFRKFKRNGKNWFNRSKTPLRDRRLKRWLSNRTNSVKNANRNKPLTRSFLRARGRKIYWPIIGCARISTNILKRTFSMIRNTSWFPVRCTSVQILRKRLIIQIDNSPSEIDQKPSQSRFRRNWTL